MEQDNNGRFLQQQNRDLILLNIAMAKQLLEIKEKLNKLIKQEEPEIKEVPEYVKLFENIG